MLAYFARFFDDLFCTSWSSVKTGCAGFDIRTPPIELNLYHNRSILFHRSEETGSTLANNWPCIVMGHNMFWSNHDIVSSLDCLPFSKPDSIFLDDFFDDSLGDTRAVTNNGRQRPYTAWRASLNGLNQTVHCAPWREKVGACGNSFWSQSSFSDLFGRLRRRRFLWSC